MKGNKVESASPSAPCAPADVSRRSFIQTLGVSAAATGIASHAEAALKEQRVEIQARARTLGPDAVKLTLSINGTKRALTVDPATTLMQALRWHLDLTGTKEVCDRGGCGACTVLVDGKPVCSCMMLATDAEGAEVTTVEGLSKDGQLDPVQEMFIKHDALQCGYCTPGLVVASRALLDRNPKPSLDEIKQALAGNLCRCGTYNNIFNAVLEASGQKPLVDAGGNG